MSTYQSTVEAQRFDLSRVDELAKWCGGRKMPSSDTFWIIVGEDTAVPGDYIVKEEHGKFMVAGEEEFLRLYHVVGGTEDREYILARLLANAEVTVPEIKLPESAFAEGYWVELGEHRFNESQWEAIQLYAAGVARAAEEERHQEIAAKLEVTLGDKEYAGPLRELVFTAVGAASTCWHGGTGPAVFDEEQATAVANGLLYGLLPYLARDGHKAQRQNREFHDAMGIATPTSPRAIPAEDVPVVLELIREEFVELIEAFGFNAVFLPNGKFLHLNQVDEPNVVEVYDAFIDILYVTYGGLNRSGMDAEPGYDEVQMSNLSKLGADGLPIIAGPNDPDGTFPGRVKKGPNYFKPNLEVRLRRQGWQG